MSKPDQPKILLLEYNTGLDIGVADFVRTHPEFANIWQLERVSAVDSDFVGLVKRKAADFDIVVIASATALTLTPQGSDYRAVLPEDPEEQSKSAYLVALFLGQKLRDLNSVPNVQTLAFVVDPRQALPKRLSVSQFEVVSIPAPVPQCDLESRKAILGSVRARVRLLIEQRASQYDTSTDWEIVGRSESISTLKKSITKVSKTDIPVLILGESGSGKELVAKAIHQLGPRSKRPFVTVNCGAIPKDMLESELFGHEKGAFTSAFNKKMGKFEVADGGTIFLDEVADLPVEQQVKLLRAIETGVINHVGGTEDITVDVRIISATNRDVVSRVREELFREDLYHRLAGATIRVPSLRDRIDDIPLLVNHFLDRYNSHYDKDLSFGRGAPIRFKLYPWVGNVRQLINAVEYLATFCEGNMIKSSDVDGYLKLHPDVIGHPKIGDISSLEDVEKAHIIGVYLRTGRNQLQTTKILGMTPKTLRGRLKKYGLLDPKQ